ncbi:MAG TPA: cupin domain-containing protein [Terriglobales bacterium]|nr:cupin domain-containing protein [Terriglobales bacterium]
MTKIMDEQALERQLRTEGFSTTYVWQDSPNAFYPDHMHPSETAHVILDGEMTVTMHGDAETYHTGDRFNIPAKAMHSARMGATGCRYLIGEK